jgi:DNA-directed RNA polymerase II subunit RPB2
MDSNAIWKIIHTYFEDNPQSLVSHHLESYNDFFQKDIFQIFKEKNPVSLSTVLDTTTGDYKHKCNLYLGGKDGTKIYFGKPVIYDESRSHYMFPNEARLRNMTYAMTVHYDIDVEFIDILAPNELPNIIGDDVIRTHGGSLNEIDIGKESENDYSRYREKPFRNFKSQSREEFAAGEAAEEEAAKRGGGPKKTTRQDNRKKVTRDKRTIKPFQMTPSVAAALREATEQSMMGNNTQRRTITLSNIYLGKFPIMLQSDFCVLKGLPKEVRHTMGECRNDVGGYFIIQGLEKTVITQEKFADNMVWIREGKETKDDDGNLVAATEYLYSAEIRSVSENVAKPIRNLSVQLVAPTSKYTNLNIVVNIPNVRKPVPLFIVFRALGIMTDRKIIEMCLLNMDKYEHMIDLFIPSVHDTGSFTTQALAIEYIASLTKGMRTEHALEILADYFLPHIGEVNYTEKAFYLGNMVFRLLSVYTNLEQPTDRDNFKYKRLELVGSLMYDLFREYYNLQLKHIQVEFEKRILYSEILYANDLPLLVQTFHEEILKNRIVENGFTKAFKGNWGAQTHTKRVGIVQDLNRLSFNTYLSHLRKTNLPMDAGSKLVEPRKLHCSQWGYIDPIDTPDGGNIGLHKSLSIMTQVTRGGKGIREPLVQWMREKISMKFIEECSTKMLSFMTKIMINGYWAGSILDPLDCVKKIKLFRRNALLPIFMSVTFDIKTNTIFVYTDSGRVSRPIFYQDDDTKKMSFEHKELQELLSKTENKVRWNDLVTGFNKKRADIGFDPSESRIYELFELYEGIEKETNPQKLERFLVRKAMIDFIDCSESENAFICLNAEDYERHSLKNYTHMEIHESLIFGNMCNLIVFPENNPPVRNSFSCGQSKQAVSLYHTNYQVRMDKTAVILNAGQIPLVKTRYLEHINHEENTYGINAMVAIMCFTGYNVEDAVLINEGALQRGLFHTTYFTTYQAHEETTKHAHVTTDLKFTNIENETEVIGTKPGYDYSKLDSHGIVREGTEVDDKTVLVGLTTTTSGSTKKVDGSKTTKKGQLGIVDKTFITEGEEGERIAKVRIREVRIPNLGDKFASRAGQKGTVGLVIPERDMPFTKDGIRPDMIINPHAIPSRMTIGHLVECLMGKACLSIGGFGDGTAFVNKGSKVRVFGDILSQMNYHSSGNELLYNGMTGEQMEAEIFFGPTYYMRLKHMVKDKINYRALGPRTALTKQPVSGRANDGGLRIGEMERDAVIAHGLTNFLTESMMERGDKYHVAICNNTGMLAICNPAKNLFMSPMADGPIKFVGSLDGKEIHIENVTKYGRSFSVVSVPYSMKLLMQELQTINIQMRIITEDNLPQLENMMFSDNIHHLMGLPVSKEYSDLEVYTKKYTDTKRGVAKKSTDIFAVLGNNVASSPEGSPEWYVAEGGKRKPPPKIKMDDLHDSVFVEVEDLGSEPDMHSYEKGEHVHFRGDSTMGPVIRVWEIMEVSPHFVTIRSMVDTVNQVVDPMVSMDGLELEEEDIKVVRPNEIYRPSEIPQNLVAVPPPIVSEEPVEYVQQADGQWVPFSPTANPNAPMAMADNLPGTKSGIHFAPVINVVGGDNTGTIDVDAAVPTGMGVPTHSAPPMASMVEPLEEVYIKAGKFSNETQNQVMTAGAFSVKKLE